MSSAVFAFTWSESDSTCQAFEGKKDKVEAFFLSR